MKRGDDRKFVAQMYWLPSDKLQERIQQDKIPYDKWYERGLLRLCAGNSINYSEVTEQFTETVKEYELFPAWVYYDSYSARYFVEEMTLNGFNHGQVHTRRENPVPAYANVRRGLAGAQGYLQQQPYLEMVLDEYGHTDRPQRQHCTHKKPITPATD